MLQRWQVGGHGFEGVGYWLAAQVELAKAMRTNQVSISRLLSGKHAPTSDTLSKLTEAFEINLYEFALPGISEGTDKSEEKNIAKMTQGLL